MANVLNTCAFVERGYGQVEPNHLSAQRTSQIYAQLPMGVDTLENGQFAKYNYAEGVVDFAGEGEWMLVYNAVKVYDTDEDAADFVMKKPVEGTGPIIGVSTDVVPRLFKTNVGDIFTTNTIKESLTAEDEGTTLYINASNGYLTKSANSEAADNAMKWQVIKVYTMPDGQPGAKIMRIA